MKKYTVLLKRPDYIADEEDTYLDHVEADNVPEAQKLAQMNAFEEDVAQEDRQDYNDDVTDDYRVLAVFVGHINDLKVET